MHYAFYIFLGNGDYHQPKDPDSTWTSTWKLPEWTAFLEKIVGLGATTLMVYLNGHYLPYKSAFFPEIVQSDHPNVQNEFFSEVLLTAKKLGLKIIAVFTTTGHAGKYLEMHPELGIKTRPSNVNLEKLLCCFPEHVRKTKHLAKEGNAQVGFGILCHNNPKGQEFALKLIKEGLTIYNQFDGVALHPPESIYPCYCDFCCESFKKQFKNDLLTVSEEDARIFYLQGYLNFQKNILEAEIISLTNKQLYIFTVPWLFEQCFEKIIKTISTNTILIDWDYNLDPDRISQLKARLQHYQEYGHTIWFMPTTRFGLAEGQELSTKLSLVQQQVKIASSTNADGIAYFMGPICAMELLHHANETADFESDLKVSHRSF